MKKIMLLVFTMALLVSCGPSAEEKAAMQKQYGTYWKDSVNSKCGCAMYETSNEPKLVITTVEPAVTSTKRKVNVYSASDFPNLVPGVIVRQMPEELPAEMTTDEFEKHDIYYHIKQYDGNIKIVKINLSEYTNLYVGDSLK